MKSSLAQMFDAIIAPDEFIAVVALAQKPRAIFARQCHYFGVYRVAHHACDGREFDRDEPNSYCNRRSQRHTKVIRANSKRRVTCDTSKCCNCHSAAQRHVRANQYPCSKSNCAARQSQRLREQVVFANEGDQINLNGWSIKSSNDNTYAFKNVSIAKDGFLNLYTTNGSDTSTALFMNRAEPAWVVGDSLSLINAEGQTVNTYVVK
jgi:hypothetical protein